MSDEIKNKTEEIEKALKGVWMNQANKDLWSFFEIEQGERIGNLLIIGAGNPVPGAFLQYEVIWVNDEKVFIDLVRPSAAFRTQHEIWLTSNSLRIAYANPINQDVEYLNFDFVR